MIVEGPRGEASTTAKRRRTWKLLFVDVENNSMYIHIG